MGEDSDDDEEDVEVATAAAAAADSESLTSRNEVAAPSSNFYQLLYF